MEILLSVGNSGIQNIQIKSLVKREDRKLTDYENRDIRKDGN